MLTVNNNFKTVGFFQLLLFSKVVLIMALLSGYQVFILYLH
jgi:hypothetical protein